MKFTLIIPTYNEAPVIGQTLETLVHALEEGVTSRGYEWSIIIADNASQDHTAEIVRAIGDERVSVLVLSEKGKGRAIRAGFLAADGEIVGFTDADLAVPPEEIIAAFFRVATKKSPLVIGSRAHPESSQPNREFWRIMSSYFFNSVVRFGVGVHFRDTQCPLKVMDLHVREIFLSTNEDTWFFDLEFLAIVERLNIPVLEVPVTWDEHRYPLRKSKLSTTADGMRSFGAIVRIRAHLRAQVAKFREAGTMGSTMKWILVGLGNPDGEYTRTRHNAGRIILDELRSKFDFPEWEYKKSYDALVTKGELGDSDILMLKPETYMNASGKSLATLVKSPEQAAQLVVVHDDVDLPIGSYRFAFARGSGGQKGVESVMSTLKTREFIRLRIGVGLKNEEGALRQKAGDIVLQKFRPEELALLKQIANGETLSNSLTSLFRDGIELSRSKWQKWTESALEVPAE